MAVLHEIHEERSTPAPWPDFNAIPTDQYVAQRQTLLNAYRAVRAHSGELTSGFTEAAQQIQSMPDASPTKWHLAHTTWFWETFALQAFKPSFEWFDEHYCYLFNSYYNAIGSQYPRPKRGLITKPGLEGVWEYRRRIDDDVERLIEGCDDGVFAELAPTLVLGLNHEQQHQELIQTDIKHGLFQAANAVAEAQANRQQGENGSAGSGNRGQVQNDPSSPEHSAGRSTDHPESDPGFVAEWGQSKDGPAGTGSSADCGAGHFWSGPDITAEWLEFPGGVTEIGYAGDGFCFDNELARHETLLAPYRLSSRLVTAGEWLAFIDDCGYQQPLLWLSDGWQWKNENGVQAPLYWQNFDGRWHRFSISCRSGPVAAIEAAQAPQRGCRSGPVAATEAAQAPQRGCRSGPVAATTGSWIPVDPDEPVIHISYYEADAFAAWRGARLPREAEWEAACAQAEDRLEGAGECWEWTQSAYSAYPGFQPTPGPAGEYNGKFMVNQMVLRGRSPATSAFHSRPSYRNFFYPGAQWQYSGLRLASDRVE